MVAECCDDDTWHTTSESAFSCWPLVGRCSVTAVAFGNEFWAVNSPYPGGGVLPVPLGAVVRAYLGAGMCGWWGGVVFSFFGRSSPLLPLIVEEAMSLEQALKFIEAKEAGKRSAARLSVGVSQ